MASHGHSWVTVTCSACGHEFSKRRDCLSTWAGKCRSCATGEIARRPEVRAKRAALARAQVLRQGGIPNAVHVPAGSNNPRWFDGRRTGAFRSLTAYRRWRLAVFERDGYRCRNCGQVGGRLQADHIKPFSRFPELRLDVDNGRTLCVPCHWKIGWNRLRDEVMPQRRLVSRITGQAI